MSEEREIYSVGLGLLGLVYGCAVAVLAIGLGGAGHGWFSASTTALGAPFAAAFGVALGSSREHRRSALLMISAAMSFVDAFLVLATRAEDMSAFWKVWSPSPGDVILWAILWIAWQIAVAVVLVHDVVAARRDKHARLCKNVDGYRVGSSIDV